MSLIYTFLGSSRASFQKLCTWRKYTVIKLASGELDTVITNTWSAGYSFLSCVAQISTWSGAQHAAHVSCGFFSGMLKWHLSIGSKRQIFFISPQYCSMRLLITVSESSYICTSNHNEIDGNIYVQGRTTAKAILVYLGVLRINI